MENSHYYESLPMDITTDDINDIFGHHGWQVEKLTMGKISKTSIPLKRRSHDAIDEVRFSFGSSRGHPMVLGRR